jgi:hypothetical protein
MPDPRPASSTRPDPPTQSLPSVASTTTTTTTAGAVAQDRPSGGLSVTQICGGALAAVTAAVAASYLGVAGTISGAAVGSVISTIAATLYSNSLKRAALASRTLVVKQTLAPAVRSPQPEVAEPPGEPEAAPHPLEDSVWQRIRWKPVMLVAGGVFVVAMAFISLSELALGHPISNSGEKGTTVSNLGGSSSQSSQTPAPATTPTPSSSDTGTPAPSASATPTTVSPSPSASAPSTTEGTAPSSSSSGASGTTAPQTTAPTTGASSSAPAATPGG